MFAQYQPNVKAAITYLKLLKVTVNNTTVNETLQNHPDWPSLLCITDSLNKWNIPNAAGKIEVDSIDALPTPFMVYTYNRENPLAIVTSVTSTAIQLYQKNYSKPAEINRDNFLKTWDGVYIIAEPNEHSGEANYKANKQKAVYKSLLPITALALITAFSLLLLYKSTGSITNAAAVYRHYFILFAGIAVTSLLLWYEIDKNNPILKKVCTGIAKGNCKAILTGKQAKVFSWLSWSETGFFYFTSSLLTLLFVPGYFSIVAWLNILALPYTAFSVYYQWRVAKQWCVLCLAVQVLLLLGAVNILLSNILPNIPQLSFLTIAACLLLFLLPALTWFAVKPYILRLQQSKNTQREYLRIKFNREIFEMLLRKQKSITQPVDDLGIDIGNPKASHTIIKVCNPYCNPCAKTHSKIEKLLAQNSNVKAKIIFTTPNTETNPSLKPARHLLAIAGKNNPLRTKQALDDWYLPAKKDYDVFEKKYPMNGELLQQGSKLEAMEKWCKVTGIEFTPTVFVNGQQLPDVYSIEDLQYFLLD